MSTSGTRRLVRIVPLVKAGLSELLEDALTQAGSRRALAAAMGITRQRLSRILRGEGGSPSPESCLRLARAQHRKAFTVLRAAGHVELADLLVELHGEPDERLTPTDRRWRRLRERLTPDDAATVEAMLVRLGKDAKKGARK